MLKSLPVAGLCFTVVLLAATLLFAAEPLKSGLQTGEMIAAIFEPLNVTGEHAGEPHCLVCENGVNPVAMIFAREPSERLTKLLAKIDATTVQNKSLQMGSFAVFLNDRDLKNSWKKPPRSNRSSNWCCRRWIPPGPRALRSPRMPM